MKEKCLCYEFGKCHLTVSGDFIPSVKRASAFFSSCSGGCGGAKIIRSSFGSSVFSRIDWDGGKDE